MSGYRTIVFLCSLFLVGCGSSTSTVMIGSVSWLLDGDFQRDYRLQQVTSYVHMVDDQRVGSLLMESRDTSRSLNDYIKHSTYPKYTITKTKYNQTTSCGVSYDYALSSFIDGPLNEHTMYMLTILTKDTIISYLTEKKKYRSHVVDDRDDHYGCDQ